MASLATQLPSSAQAGGSHQNQLVTYDVGGTLSVSTEIIFEKWETADTAGASQWLEAQVPVRDFRCRSFYSPPA
jgi:hypothetical protein